MSAALLAVVAACFGAPPASGGNIAYRAGSVLTLAGGNFSGSKPTGVAVGDVLYAVFLWDGGAAPALAGWSTDATATTPTNSFDCLVLRRIADGSEGATLTFPTGASAGQGVVFALSGVNASPVDATTTVGVGATATITYPSITTANPFSWHVAIACNFNATPSTPGGYTPRIASAAWSATFSKNIASASTVSGVTSTGGGDWAAFSLAVRSA